MGKDTVKKISNIQYLKDKDMEKVRGVFKFYEQPGQTLRFPFRKYDEPIHTYELIDGHEYTIPLCVARHLNNNCKTPVHSNILDTQGKPQQVVNRYQARFGFVSTELFDIPLEERG